MTFARQRYGAESELRARRFLESRGLTFEQGNAATPYGEIDLVMRDQDVRVFVEVKARRSGAAGAPQEAVTSAKLRHIIESAEWIAANRADERPWRIDVVAVTPGRIEHLANVTAGMV